MATGGAEEGSMAALIEPHIPALRRFAWALLRNEAAADDLVQDCLERAISRWHLRRREGSPKAWLFTILHNLFLSGRRTAARRGPALPLDDEGEDGLALADPASARAAEGRLAWRDTLAALEALPEEQRAVLLLVGVEDFSYEAAARLTGVPIGTVMSRLSRGRERLRRLLDGEEMPGQVRPALRRVK
jgi:RNA polymerase sigma-70 factor, ECF subfamily